MSLLSRFAKSSLCCVLWFSSSAAVDRKFPHLQTQSYSTLFVSLFFMVWTCRKQECLTHSTQGCGPQWASADTLSTAARFLSESSLNNLRNLLSRSRVKQTVICVCCVFSQPGDAAAAADINQAGDELHPRGGRWGVFKVIQIRCEQWRGVITWKALPWNDSSSCKQVPQQPGGSCMHHTVYSPLSSGCVNIVEQNREFAGGSPTGVTARVGRCLRPNGGPPRPCSTGTRLWSVRFSHKNESSLLTVKLSSPPAVLAFSAN